MCFKQSLTLLFLWQSTLASSSPFAAGFFSLDTEADSHRVRHDDHLCLSLAKNEEDFPASEVLTFASRLLANESYLLRQAPTDVEWMSRESRSIL